MVWHILAQAAVKVVAKKIISEVTPEEYCDQCGSQKKKRWFANRMSYVCETCVDPDFVKAVGNGVKAVELAVSKNVRVSTINVTNRQAHLL